MAMNATSFGLSEEASHDPAGASHHEHDHSHLSLTVANVLLALWACLANLIQVRMTGNGQR